MQRITPKSGIPVHVYLQDLDQGTLEQAEWCARLPHAFHHIALMPDAHHGFAMPVGGVMALKGAVMPNAVGVDIGCGMVAARTDLDHQKACHELKNLAEAILHRIPTGFDHHKKPQRGEIVERVDAKGKDKRKLRGTMPVVAENLDSIPYQLGTLGGGNHFIELQRDREGYLWVMLHSGSRNVGLKIAKNYHKLAQQYCRSIKSPLPADYAFLPLELPEAQLYLTEMQWAMDFAMQNRLHMLDEVFNVFRDVLRADVKRTLEVRTHHNYASLETHFGERVWVHRKGAVRAADGELVTIPGSMGTRSYIARGKGCADSFRSCSHGAGRRKGRKQALRELSERDLRDQLGDVVIATPKLGRVIDEAPSVYKDIEDVMARQADMAEIVYELIPLAVVKG